MSLATAAQVALVAGSAQAATAPAPPSFVQSLVVESPSMLFAVGPRSIARTSAGGRSWRTFAVPVRAIAGAAFVGASDWWVAGASVGTTTRVPIVFTRNAGATWQRVLLPRRYPDGHGQVHFSFVDARNGWLTVDTVHGSAFANVDLYRTTNGGARWRYLGSQPFQGPIAFIGARSWATTGPDSSGLAVSGDSGRRWLTVSLPIPPALKGQARTVALPQALGRNALALATVYSRPVGDRDVNTVVIYVSDDGGRRWQARAPLADPGFGSYERTLIPTAFATAREWLVAGGIKLHLTEDAGRHWRAIEANTASSGLDSLVGIAAVHLPTPRVGFGLIQSGNCRHFKSDCTQRSFIVRSDDGGRHWRLLSLDPSASSAPLCRPVQLATRAAFGGATGSALGGVALRNASGTACSLPRRPLLAIAWNGRALALRQSRPLGRLMFPQVPVRVLRPGGRAFVNLQWFNWCRKRPKGPMRVAVLIRLTANGSTLAATAHDAAVPRCDAPPLHSLLWVGDFVEPPA